MKSLLIILPASIGIAGVVTRLTIETLNLSMEPSLILAAVALYTAMLFRRSIAALAVIGCLACFANYSLGGMGSLQVSADILLAAALTVIVLPMGLRLMGMEPVKSLA